MNETIVPKNRKSIRKTVATIVGVTIFSVGVLYSSYEISKTEISVNYHLIPQVLFLAMLSALLSSLRFQISGLLFRVRIPYGDAITVTSYGTLANLLPIPGALIIRFEYLRKKTSVQKSSFIQIVSILSWFSVGFITLAAITTTQYRLLALFLSALMLLASIYLVWRTEMSGLHFFGLYLLQSVMTFLNIMKIWLIFSVLSLSVSPSVPAALAITDIVASSSVIVPSGIGLAESAAAAVTGFFEIHPSIGFLVASLNRASMWTVLLVLLMLINLYKEKEQTKRENSK